MHNMMGSKRPGVSGKESHEYNIALLGAVGSGKSALTVKYITRRFIMEYDPTLEDTYAKIDNVDGQEITVRVMDTYDALDDGKADRYLAWAHGFVVVYSITSRTSYERATQHLDKLTQYSRESGRETPIVLVGNKMDLERYRTVSRAEGEALGNEFDCSFFEASAAEDMESVEVFFKAVLRDISTISILPLQPLFISEDKTGLSTSNGSKMAFKRHKSPRTSQESKEGKKEEKAPKILPRRTVSSFRLFNYKNFKIFN